MSDENTKPLDIDIDAELAAMFGEVEETVPVILAVPNGLVQDGRPMFVPATYEATTTTLMQVQALLETGSKLNVPDVVARAKAAIAVVTKDESLAEQIAAHLVELDLLK